MGGFGSGRRGGRATVEGCRSLKLDVNIVTRAPRDAVRGLSDGEVFTAKPRVWSWTVNSGPEPVARIVVLLSLGRDSGHARLLFDIDHATRRTGPQDQRVEMATTPCRFGGRRWWWVCPATGRRCAKLYLPNGGTRFLGRGPGAYRLPYASQSASPMERSHGRLARLCRRLGARYDCADDPPPPRPKWMRHRTYARMVSEWESEVGRLDGIFVAGIERLVARIDRRPQ